MFRLLLVTGALAFGIVAVAAQTNPAQELNNTMGVFADNAYQVLNRMVRGEMPYDQAKVDDAFAKLTQAAAKLPDKFPDSLKGQSSPDSRYFANDKIWQNKADVVERARKLDAVLREVAPKVHSLDDLKKGYPTVNDACNGCHREYRSRKS
jgi:cytochrome c556